MSYILDALKKNEHEKVRKAVPAGMTKISGDLFREERPRPMRGGAWKLVAVAVLAALVAVAGTWLLLSPPRKPAPVAFRRFAPPEQQPVAAPVLPPVPPAVPVVAVPPAAQATPRPVPHSPPSPAAGGAKDKAMVVQQSVRLPSKAEQRREAARLRAERDESESSQAVSRRAPAVLAAPPADIKVSGIAWGDERKTRRAVINGFLLKEGSVVGGARISEIMKDRVRFSQSGNTFEISMAAPGIPAPTPGTAK
ncbi:MAG: hypothetical protein HXX11_18890 [Desulfuromonadales bacterium]|nr:hypothetical protein [Desulfuromonadales bacterium]